MERNPVNHDYITHIQPWSEVRVTWRDAYSPASGWHDVDDYQTEDDVAVTLGRYWANCQEHYITIVGTVFTYEGDTPKTIGDINHIPLGWISKIEILGA
jgi:hypothetical protein